jgi:hypothetical protein
MFNGKNENNIYCILLEFYVDFPGFVIFDYLTLIRDYASVKISTKFIAI